MDENFWDKLSNTFLIKTFENLSSFKNKVAFNVLHKNKKNLSLEKKIYLFEKTKLIFSTLGELPKFSNDGKFLAFLNTTNKDLWIYNLKKNIKFKLTSFSNPIKEYIWSPTNTQLVIITELKNSDKLYLIDLNGKKSSLFPKNSKFILKKEISWSSDGKNLAFTIEHSKNLGDWFLRNIYILNIKDKKIKKLFSEKKCHENPIYSPDGKYIAYKTIESPEKGGGWSELYIYDLKKKIKLKLPSTLNQRSHILGWQNANTIYIIDQEKTKNCIYKITLPNLKVEKIIKDGFISNVSISNLGLFYIKEDVDKSPELFFENLQLTHFNEHIGKVSKTKKINFKIKGRNIEYFLTFPKNYNKNKKYPLILAIHGGPVSSFKSNFIQKSKNFYPIATLSSSGYFILRCNVFGSMGYGRKFRENVYNLWGNLDYLDLIKCIDNVLKIASIDKQKMGVIGFSYGGYLAAYILSKTKRFKAAVIGNGFMDLKTWINTSNYKNFLKLYFKEINKKSKNFYSKRSPLTYSNKIKTPILLIHAKNDKIVPYSQSKKFYEKIKSNTEVKLITYPNASHINFSSKQFLNIWKEEIDLFEKFLK